MRRLPAFYRSVVYRNVHLGRAASPSSTQAARPSWSGPLKSANDEKARPEGDQAGLL